MSNKENIPLPEPQIEHFADRASAQEPGVSDIFERVKNFKYDPSRSEEIARQQRELMSARDVQRAEKLKSFSESLGIQRNVIDAVLNTTIDLEPLTSSTENSINNPASSLIDSVVGSDTSEQARLDAQSALGVIREELKFAGGDHETARKEIMRRYHPDVDKSGLSTVIPWVNKLWDSESKQFKL